MPKDQLIQYRETKELRAKMQATANRLGMSLAQLIRTATREYCDRFGEQTI